MSKTQEKYVLTPEHEAQLKPWADKWIENALSTKGMDDEEKKECEEYVRSLYTHASLPEPKNVAFVSSPFVLAVAGGLAAAMWWIANNPNEVLAIELKEALAKKQGGQSDNPVIKEIIQAVQLATKGCGLECNFVTDGTRIKDTHDKWFDFPISTRSLSDVIGLGEFGASCCAKSQNMWNGGNQWSAAASCLSFFRHIAELDLDYSKWHPYEELAKKSGPRIMHSDFCLVSDRPEILKIDDQSRPHCGNGPFCKWRDGTALYTIHGVRLPKWIVENPELITHDKVDAENNIEVRRIMVERYPGGKEKYVKDSGAEKVHEDDFGILWRKDQKGDEPILMVEVINSTPEPDGTYRNYSLRVPPTMTTAKEAVAWTCHLPAEDYNPVIES
jgi:hypothetical protein